MPAPPNLRPRFRHALAAAWLCLALCVAPGTVQALELIAHPGLTLGADEVREVYLGERQLSGGVKLMPVDNVSAQEEFAARVLRLEIRKYTALWIKKAFREGLAVPALRSTDAEVAEFVRATPGALGYVNVAPPGVRVIARY